MNKIKTVIILFCFSMSITAQIPNAGFENWSDELTPESWVTNNFLSAWTPVVRSNNSKSGTYAAKLEIVNYNGIPMIPTMTITFPVTQAYGALNGYYQLHQTNNTEFLGIVSYYWANGTVVGGNVIELNVATSTYLPFSIELDAAGSSPDSIWIQMIVVSDGDDPGFGAYALVDDLSFGMTTDVEQFSEVPTSFALNQNYPNPFNPTTTISYSIPSVRTGSNLQENVNLTIYDLLGREVKNLVNEFKQPGNYEVTFDASSLTSGIYYYTLSSSNFSQTKKMLLIK
ncbi:MAG: T9SS type A sorting domain-containing protein [Melioribacteraceae bacterium]|nr:T9SS type A sorting domain-containing protein [Melioribacteraceae bacterium]